MALSLNVGKNLPLLFSFLLLLAVLKPEAARGQAPETAAVQTTAPQATPAPEPPVPPVDKRILGVLPNYRTAEMTPEYHPITAKYKLTIAAKDSFDYPLIMVASVYAGLYQLDNSHPQFGQGVKGYFSRLGTSYTDQITGNMMTEGFMPILFREDPRYFRMAEGSSPKRLFYALSRILVTRTDSGGSSFNFAEIVGNGIGAGVGMSYYPDDRHPGGYLENFGTSLATDATSQVLKEFWPDVKRWWHSRHPEQVSR
jgi:hypothetical protein